tara:strand:- start:91 stop:1077 length:987 start_codon:yes stop_codon:yes gene_type:complete
MKLLFALLKSSYRDAKKAPIILGILALFIFTITLSLYDNTFYIITIPVGLFSMLILLVILHNNYTTLKDKEELWSDGRHVFNGWDGKEIITLKNGKRNGKYEKYYVNSRLNRGGFIEGSPGGLSREINYKDGLQHGETLSYTKDGALFRKVNLEYGEYVGDIYEYYKNGNYRMINNGNKYTFFSEYGLRKCEVYFNIDSVDGNIFGKQKPIFMGEWINKGVWKNYDDNGLLEYELYDWDNSSNCVKKKVYFNNEDDVEISLLSFDMLDFAHLKFLKDFVDFRMNDIKYSWSSGFKGPPGASSWGVTPIEICPICDIEDILSLSSVKSQ